jgi:hypothetical protein
MKSFSALALLLSLALLVAPQARAAADPGLDTKLQALHKAVAAALDQRAAAPPTPTRGGSSAPDEATANAASLAYQQQEREATAHRLLAVLLLRGADLLTPSEMEQALSQLAAATDNDPAVLAAGVALRDAVRTGQSARAAKVREEIDALLTRAGQTCLAAAKPEDLDDLIKALAPYNRARGGDSSYASRSPLAATPESVQRAGQAWRFVTLWQDYLALRPKGGDDTPAAADASRLNSIINELVTLADAVLVPRSRILALRPAASPATPAAGGRGAGTGGRSGSPNPVGGGRGRGAAPASAPGA